MDNHSILAKVNEIFVDILDEEDIVLTLSSTADDVEDWDSLVHIQLIVGIEKFFEFKFTAMEVEQFNKVGDIVNTIAKKL